MTLYRETGTEEESILINYEDHEKLREKCKPKAANFATTWLMSEVAAKLAAFGSRMSEAAASAKRRLYTGG